MKSSRGTLEIKFAEMPHW